MLTALTSGQVAIVTGGGSGIGRQAALLFAEEGAKAVAVTDIADQAVKETVRLIEERGARALSVTADIADPDTPDSFIRVVREEFGPINCAVNCAGVNGPVKPIGEYTDEDWNKVFAVNLHSVFRSMRAEVRAMSADGGGAIVNVSSGSVIDPVPNMAAYVASKQAILALTRAAAGEYARAGIRINAVLPGATNTQMLAEHAKTEQGKKQVASHPLGRWGEPREVAEAIVWLCSARSSYLTGVELPVDGGSHAFWYPTA